MFPFGRKKPMPVVEPPPPKSQALEEAKKRIRELVKDADERTDRVLQRLRTREAKGSPT